MLPQGFGLCIPWQGGEIDSDYYARVISEFNPPCWYNHKFDMGGDSYLPMLWEASSVNQYASGIQAAQSGNIWLLGNEPEVSTQSNDTPAEFASAVRYWKNNIGRPFAIPGILWGQAGRDWWTEYEKLNAPKPDAYHIHIYAYSGVSWYNHLNNALQVFTDRPLIISECGGWSLSPAENAEIMRNIHTALVLRRIPAAFWFSSHYSTWDPSWLYTDCLNKNEVITDVGSSYKYWCHKKNYDAYLPVIMV